MTRAYVLPVASREAEINTLQALIEAEGCEIVCDDSPIDAFEKCISDADVLVILICAETAGNKLVEDAVRRAQATGKRIIGIWSAKPSVPDVLEILEKLADGILGWNDPKLGEVVCGGEIAWHTPAGTPRARPKTPRHKAC